jgi:hypothetical protein
LKKLSSSCEVITMPAPHPPTTHSADQPPNSGRQDAGEGGHGEPENMRIDERMRKRLEVCGKYGWFKGNQYRRWNHMGMDTK